MTPRWAICVLVLAPLTVAKDCTWCEDGDAQCDWSFADFVRGSFSTSISDAVGGRGFPYWRPAAQPEHGVGSAARLAILVHHGAGRNAEDYTSYMANAVLRAGLSLGDDVLVLGPQVFEVGDDGLDESVIWWDASTDDGIDADAGERDWKWGGNSTADLPSSISTFQVLDELVQVWGDRMLYPNLQSIILAGHSAGGQIMQRYALFSRADIDVPIQYFVANPSSVTYLGPERPVHTTDKTCGNYCDNTTILTHQQEFAVPSNSTLGGCLETYNLYGYGLDGALPDYVNKTGVNAALEAYPMRRVTYMSGESDVCDAEFTPSCVDCEVDDGGLDGSCEASAQGWCRMARLHAFSQYVAGFFDGAAHHTLLSVPHVGHSGCGMFQSATFAAAALTLD